jgi:hypothetical protein
MGESLRRFLPMFLRTRERSTMGRYQKGWGRKRRREEEKR